MIKNERERNPTLHFPKAKTRHPPRNIQQQDLNIPSRAFTPEAAMIAMPQRIDEQIFTDAQLLVLIVRGDNWALSEIHARYAGLVFSIAFKILNDRVCAEEVVQQVFTKVWRHARLYQLERGKFSAWVSKITHRQCIDELRRSRTYLLAAPGDWEWLDRVASSDDLDQDVQAAFEQTRIREALQQIPARERVVIELAFWGGMSHQEIALHCHFPLGTVQTRLRLGMQRLKLLLQEPA